MSLSPAAEREQIHTRDYEFHGYRRKDGLWDIEGHLTDTKTYGFSNEHRGTIAPGDPIHDMWIRLTLDDDFTVRAIEVETASGPYGICPAIAPNFQRVVGLTVGAGWRGQIRERLGGVEGCTHLVEMLGAMATAAFQTMFPILSREREGAEAPGPAAAAAEFLPRLPQRRAAGQALLAGSLQRAGRAGLACLPGGPAWIPGGGLSVGDGLSGGGSLTILPAMAKTRSDDLQQPFRHGEGERLCAAPDCLEPGRYRAPLSPQRPSDYQWLCLEHVRQFNASWDAFRGLGEAEIERQRRNDAVWQRPSWPFAGSRERAAAGPESFADPFGFFRQGRAESRPQPPASAQERALAVLGLGCEATFECVKTRYKELVKKLHPDANGRDRDAEERLKAVNQAYTTLKSSFTP